MNNSSSPCLDVWGTVITASNATSLTINILHLYILTRLDILKGVKYRNILIHITLADIISSLSLTVIYSCRNVFLIYELNKVGVPQGWQLVAVHSSIGVPFYTYYWIFVIAAIEQYYAICQPLRYSQSIFTRHISRILALVWLIVTILVCLQMTLSSLYATSPAVFFSILGTIDCAYKLTPCIVTSSLLTRSMMELSHMSNRQPTEGTHQLRTMAVYLTAIFTIFAIYTLFDITVTVYDMTYTLSNEFVLDRVRNTVKPAYGILNTVIYGWRTKAYRQQIRRRATKLLKC